MRQPRDSFQSVAEIYFVGDNEPELFRLARATMRAICRRRDAHCAVGDASLNPYRYVLMEADGPFQPIFLTDEESVIGEGRGGFRRTEPP